MRRTWLHHDGFEDDVGHIHNADYRTAQLCKIRAQTRQGTTPVKTNTGNKMPEKMPEKMPGKCYQHLARNLVRFPSFSTVLVAFQAPS